MTNYEIIEGAIPEGGVAHMIPNVGKLVVNEKITDGEIELLPEDLRSKYFKKKEETAES